MECHQSLCQLIQHRSFHNNRKFRVFVSYGNTTGNTPSVEGKREDVRRCDRPCIEWRLEWHMFCCSIDKSRTWISDRNTIATDQCNPTIKHIHVRTSQSWRACWVWVRVDIWDKGSFSVWWTWKRTLIEECARMTRGSVNEVHASAAALRRPRLVHA